MCVCVRVCVCVCFWAYVLVVEAREDFDLAQRPLAVRLVVKGADLLDGDHLLRVLERPPTAEVCARAGVRMGRGHTAVGMRHGGEG